MLRWRMEGGTLYRYYYLFSFRELQRALSGVDLAVLKRSGAKGTGLPGRPFSGL